MKAAADTSVAISASSSLQIYGVGITVEAGKSPTDDIGRNAAIGDFEMSSSIVSESYATLATPYVVDAMFR